MGLYSQVDAHAQSIGLSKPWFERHERHELHREGDPIIGWDGADARPTGLRGLQTLSVTRSVAETALTKFPINCGDLAAGFFFFLGKRGRLYG